MKLTKREADRSSSRGTDPHLGLGDVRPEPTTDRRTDAQRLAGIRALGAKLRPSKPKDPS